MELCPPLHLGVVAIKKRSLVLPSTKVANFTFTLHISYFPVSVAQSAGAVEYTDCTSAEG